MDRQSNKEFKKWFALSYGLNLKCLKNLDIHQTIEKLESGILKVNKKNYNGIDIANF